MEWILQPLWLATTISQRSIKLLIAGFKRLPTDTSHFLAPFVLKCFIVSVYTITNHYIYIYIYYITIYYITIIYCYILHITIALTIPPIYLMGLSPPVFFNTASDDSRLPFRPARCAVDKVGPTCHLCAMSFCHISYHMSLPVYYRYYSHIFRQRTMNYKLQ